MEKLLELIKLSPKYLFGISIVSGLLLFTEDIFIVKLGIQQFVNQNRSYIGVIFLISLVFTITEFLLNSMKSIKNKYIRYKKRRIAIERLRNLTIEEKQILGDYIFNVTRTRNLPVENGLVQELVRYQILYRSSNIGSFVEGFSFNMQPWAWKYLNKHKKLLLSHVDEVGL